MTKDEPDEDVPKFKSRVFFKESKDAKDEDEDD